MNGWLRDGRDEAEMRWNDATDEEKLFLSLGARF